ncbi:MAG: hypothetical protein M0R44_06845 [Candidatus Marinimicrobia bacterium]|jgi:uncharacterized damage-inducible protein DinB|nr:hypothetical protein [Candidatus Neomarinimicrobiota bacterium]
MVQNGWTESFEKQRAEIATLREKVLRQDNLLEAMKETLKARERMINDTITELSDEKRANLNWQDFAHKAILELRRYRTLAGLTEDQDGIAPLLHAIKGRKEN